MAVWAISTAIVLWNLRKVAKHLGGPARAIVALSIAFLPVVALVSAINHQTYDLRVWNETDKMIDDVSVHMAGKSHSFGVMSSGVTATRAFQPDRPASSAEIRWTGEDGRAHVVEVDLSDVVPRRYDRGVLTFTIYAEESVRAGFFIRKDYAF